MKHFSLRITSDAEMLEADCKNILSDGQNPHAIANDTMDKEWTEW